MKILWQLKYSARFGKSIWNKTCFEECVSSLTRFDTPEGAGAQVMPRLTRKKISALKNHSAISDTKGDLLEEFEICLLKRIIADAKFFSTPVPPPNVITRNYLPNNLVWYGR